MVQVSRRGLVSLVVLAMMTASLVGITQAANSPSARAVGPVAFDMVNSTGQNLASFTDDPAVPFSSPADGFTKFRRGVSPSIPFAVLDDSLVIFPGDRFGIIKDGNTDEFFGVADTVNNDTSGPVTATWVFNITDATKLALSINMGAMGDFESADVFRWDYSIDGGPVTTIFQNTVNEAGSHTYTLEGGGMFTLNDPMLVDGTILTNDLATFTKPLAGTGSFLTLSLTAETNGSDEAFVFQDIVISGDGGPPVPDFGVCGDGNETPIHDIQGAGLASPEAGTTQVVEGVVVGDFQDTVTGLSGFFMQEEDLDADGNAMTSEGIFVFDNGFGVDVDAGDVVRVRGNVSEAGSLTQLSGVKDVAECPDQVGGASAAPVTLPVAAVADLESTEAMLVDFPQTLYASGNFSQARFGEVDLSVGGPLDNPTNVVAPGPAANALQDLNDRSRIQLDDGSRVQNPLPLPPYLGDGNTLRTGDVLPDGITAVLGFAGVYELHPVGPVSFTRVNARPSVPDVGGSIQVAAYNVLNYFTTLDDSGPICGPNLDQGCRGADTADEFTRQRNKLVAAISALDADVVGLMEIENYPGDVPTADLVAGLNAVVGAGTYDYIATGAIGSDAIRQAILYQPASVSPLGAFETLDSTDDPLFVDTLNRPMVVQSFVENATGAVFTVGVNHLKSKGSDCDAVGDPDIGDGQGNCNLTRTKAAQAIVDYLAGDPTDSGDGDFLIIGDLNAYAMEDPVTTLEAGGYTDLIEALVGSGFGAGAYSFNFFSQSGYLDHGLSSGTMTPQVTGAAFWHVNADEPSGLDYNNFNQPGLYNPDEFRSSDHDPVIVGLALDAVGQKKAARANLSALLPTGNKQDDKRISKAIGRIDMSLNPGWWTGPSTLDPKKGKHVFDREHQAVQELMKVRTADVQGAIDDLVDADRLLAMAQLTAAINGGGSAVWIARAQANMADAEAHVAAGDYAKAVLDFKKAWMNAIKA
jgi:predicted extracellular nuclease